MVEINKRILFHFLVLVVLLVGLIFVKDLSDGQFKFWVVVTLCAVSVVNISVLIWGSHR